MFFGFTVFIKFGGKYADAGIATQTNHSRDFQQHTAKNRERALTNVAITFCVI